MKLYLTSLLRDAVRVRTSSIARTRPAAAWPPSASAGQTTREPTEELALRKRRWNRKKLFEPHCHGWPRAMAQLTDHGPSNIQM